MPTMDRKGGERHPHPFAMPRSELLPLCHLGVRMELGILDSKHAWLHSNEKQ